MTHARAQLTQPERPRRLLKLVAATDRYAWTEGDTAASPAAQARTSATTSAEPVVPTDPYAPRWALAAAVSASVVAITVTSGHRRGRGAGVILDTAGDILTRCWVVADAGEGATLWVTLKDKRIFEAKVIDTDPSIDFALIKLTHAPNDLRAIALEDVKAFPLDDSTAS